MSFYRDVEFDVEIEYTIKAKSDIVNFDHTKKDVQKVTVEGKNIEGALWAFSEAVGFDLTIEQFLEVVFSDVNTLRDLVNGYHDSSARSLFCDAFANFVFRSAGVEDGRSWPCGRHSREYTDKFFADLNESVEGLGYYVKT